jgi:DNA-directed RNA polymerase specialized sigma subunit
VTVMQELKQVQQRINHHREQLRTLETRRRWLLHKLKPGEQTKAAGVLGISRQRVSQLKKGR